MQFAVAILVNHSNICSVVVRRVVGPRQLLPGLTTSAPADSVRRVVKTLRLCYELRTAKLYRKMYWVARWELTRTFRRGLPTCHSRKCKLRNPKRNKSPQSFSAKNRVPECILHTEQEEVLLGEPAALSSCRSAGAATIVALPTTIALRTQVKR